MIIKGSKILGEDGQFFAGWIRTNGGTIVEVVKDSCGCGNVDEETSGEEVYDAGSNLVIPGLVDIHFHGCVGADFCDGTKEAFDTITAYQEANGVTSIVPATMTLSREELARIFKAAGEYENSTGSLIRGINMEGPFVSMAKKGAQNGAYIHKPDVDFFREMQGLCGNLIKQVAVAPEEDVDLTFIRTLADEVVCSVAHTTADYDTASAAFDAGANHVTHLFNAMPAFTHRGPGVVGAAFDHKDVMVELICDGIHIHPSMMRAVFALFGADRVCVISDSMMATGLGNGDYALGGQPVQVVGRLATLADGTIAGSASNLMDCVRVLVKQVGLPIETAVMAASLNPAKSLGLDGVCGSIAVGKAAQVVVLDENLEIVRVVNERA